MSSEDDVSVTTFSSGMLLGENGDPSYVSTGNILLDFNNTLVRGLDKDRISDFIQKILSLSYNDIKDLFVLMFITRNCRGGKGERELFHIIFDYLFIAYPFTSVELLKLIPHYGYWKDIIHILSRSFNTGLCSISCVNLIVKQLSNDWNEFKENPNSKNISLCCKYAPRPGMHFARYNKIPYEKIVESFYDKFHDPLSSIANFGSKEKFYRKSISSLNTHLDTVEKHMCSETWGTIDFTKAPSLCVNKWRSAFLNEKISNGSHELRFPDNPDRMLCRMNIMRSVKEKKIKGGQLQPHQIIQSLNINNGCLPSHTSSPSNEEVNLLHSQWDSMRESLKLKFAKPILAMSDVSGSMMNGQSNVTPMFVSIAMGILLSELTCGPFANKVLTFSGNPRFVDFSDCSTLSEKVIKITEDKSCEMNTNLIKAFEMILDIALRDNLTSEQLPSLIIFSDMQFDQSCRHNESTFTTINRMFSERGLIRPTLIYWNLNCKDGIPVVKDEINTILMSGYSPSLFKYVISGEKVLTPDIIFRMMLDDSIYDPIRVNLDQSTELNDF